VCAIGSVHVQCESPWVVSCATLTAIPLLQMSTRSMTVEPPNLLTNSSGPESSSPATIVVLSGASAPAMVTCCRHQRTSEAWVSGRTTAHTTASVCLAACAAA
jgi:hypothetical protein